MRDIRFGNGDPASLTDAQVGAIERVLSRYPDLDIPFVEVHPIFMSDGAVGMWLGNMFIGIETDGYTHT